MADGRIAMKLEMEEEQLLDADTVVVKGEEQVSLLFYLGKGGVRADQAAIEEIYTRTPSTMLEEKPHFNKEDILENLEQEPST